MREKNMFNAREERKVQLITGIGEVIADVYQQRESPGGVDITVCRLIRSPISSGLWTERLRSEAPRERKTIEFAILGY